MSIQILEEQLANQIAAGEVIERPASVVKELVENAIDAGATDIEVIIEEAGRKLIQVTDNGVGMTRQDAVLCLQRHATSKITTADDLFAIRTLGFRGEALPSIASVSHLRVVTRLHDRDIGTELLVHGGVITDLHDIGCPPGAQFEVAQLFYNTPARLKFLKSDQTEVTQIVDLVNALSLCHHTINVRLLSNGRELLSRASSGSMLAHISAWLGRSVAESAVALDLETPGIRVDGYVGKPESARGNRSAQLFFINGRRITNRMLTHALEYSFEGLLTPKRYPVAVVRITMDPTQLDVNVHPAKAEVRFHREGEVHATVVRAIKMALGQVSMIQELATWEPSAQNFSRATTGKAVTSMQNPPVVLPSLERLSPEQRQQASITMPSAVSAPSSSTDLRAIGQFHGTFLLAEGRDALLLINQHRAHERVIFERLWASYTRVESQRLVLPATLHLGHHEAVTLDTNLDALQGFGFEIEAMSGQSYLIRAVPAILAGQNPETMLQGILLDLATGTTIAQFTCDDPTQRTLEESRRRLLASLACKGAIKAGKILSPIEQTELLEQLKKTELPTTCPHGAPIMMTITQYELDRKFIR